MEKIVKVEVLVEWTEEAGFAGRRAEAAGRSMWTDEKVGRVEVSRRVSPRSLAQEAEARAAFLRSRPLSEERGLGHRELWVLTELDSLSARGRVAALAEERGLSSQRAIATELDELDKLAFACFGRFEGLLAALDERFPTRAKATDPEARRKELEQIERFLAERK
ncbi:MAG: hypothetical protein ACYDCL_10200 [Myxococcales bacterium]